MPSAFPRSLILISIGLLACASCGTSTSTPSTAKTVPSPIQLTAEEYAKLFSGSAAIRKLASPEGAPVRAVRIEVIEDGKVLTSMTATTGDAKTLTKIIAVVGTEGDSHLSRVYLEHASGSALSSSTAWFSKPLNFSSKDIQTAPQPILPGRTILLSGHQIEPPAAGGSMNLPTGQQAPCRIELVVE